MMNNFICGLMLFSGVASSQEFLSLDDALKIGLEKNFDIQTEKNVKQIASYQNNAGNAGLSPTISLTGNLNFSNLNSHQEFATGTIQDRPGATANNNGLSINANWTVFDGFRMFAIKKRLQLNEGLSALALKQQMEQTVSDIILAWHNVVRIKQLLKAANQNLSIYEERRKVAAVKLDIGSDSKVDLLLSRSDENKARSAIVQLELELLTAKTNLNTLLNRTPGTDFNTPDTINLGKELAPEELKKNLMQSNTQLQMQKQQELISEQSIKEGRALNLPFVQVGASYLFSSSSSQAGIVLFSRQNGLNAGVTLNWLLFNGNRNRRLVQERELLSLNARTATEQARLQIDALVYIQYQTFLLNKKLVDLEIQNLTDSKEVQQISLERYRIGKANLLETIETQKNLEDAQVRYVNALYALKSAETQLLRVNGSLVK
jgi:outer membrane protein